MKSITVIVAALLLASPALAQQGPAQQKCGSRTKLIAALANKYMEQPRWGSITTDGGFIEAWGSYGEAAGYFPGAQSIGTAVAGGTATGVLEDAGSWTFQSLDAPWLYVGVYPNTAGTPTFRSTMRIVVDEG